MVVKQSRRRLVVGQLIEPRSLAAVVGEPVELPDRDRLVHLQFRRFAGCPVCHLHLRSIVRRHDEIRAAGVREVVVFHSRAEELRPQVTDLPFAVVADPGKRLYVEFGVQAGWRAVLDPRAWMSIAGTVPRDLAASVRTRKPPPWFIARGGRLGLPADLLIAGDGRVLAVKYGSHAYDQWSVDELLDLARADGSASSLP